MKCRLCPTEIEQGKSGYEIGIVKWLNDIKPFPILILVCEKHYQEIAEKLNITDFEAKKIQE